MVVQIIADKLANIKLGYVQIINIPCTAASLRSDVMVNSGDVNIMPIPPAHAKAHANQNHHPSNTIGSMLVD